nr:transposase [Oceanirhabdus seepicola]
MQFKINEQQEGILNKRLEIGRKLYNAILGHSLKQHKTMIERKYYRKVKNSIIEINKKIKNCKDKKKLKIIEAEKKKLYKELNSIHAEFGLNEYALINYTTPLYKPFKKNIDNKTAQAIASRAWKAIDKLLKGEADRIYFKKYNEFNSLEGKWNKSGLKYDGMGNIVWNELKIPVIIKNNDTYAQMALQDRVKYCRVIRRLIRGKYKYYVQLVLEGIPPIKVNKETGEIKRRVGIGSVGLDIGTKTIAVASDYSVKLFELCPEINNIYKIERKLQRTLDRQRRSNNPSNYNEDGTIKIGIKLIWNKSNKYIRTQNRLSDIKRKQKVIRKQSHEILANYIISLGDTILVEDMNYKGLQKRAKNTTKNKKGKFNKKKRFGKSLANKAPSMLLTIIDRKLQYEGLELNEVDTKNVKASQYNHIEDKYIKKSLSERWNDFGEFKIQRDLYSSFIIKNVIVKNLNSIDRENMICDFEKFKELHDEEIQRLKELKKDNYKFVSSFGI